MYAADLIFRKTLNARPRPPARMGLAAAERADIEGVRAKGGFQCRVIQLGIMGQGDNCGAGMQGHLLHGHIRPFKDQSGVRKSLFRGKYSARVYNCYIVAGQARHTGKRPGDMHSPDDDKLGIRVKSMDKITLVIYMADNVGLVMEDIRYCVPYARIQTFKGVRDIRPYQYLIMVIKICNKTKGSLIHL